MFLSGLTVLVEEELSLLFAAFGSSLLACRERLEGWKRAAGGRSPEHLLCTHHQQLMIM